jgi:hypothetical protein
MNTPRLVIRKTLKSLLTDNFPRVKLFMNRTAPKELSDLPCILVFFNDESSEMHEEDILTDDREMQLFIDIVFGGNTETEDYAEDYLDDLSFLIEKFFKLTPTLSLDFIESIHLTRIHPIIIVDDKALELSALRMIYTINWICEFTLENNLLNEFKKFDAQYKIENNEAKDSVIIR